MSGETVVVDVERLREHAERLDLLAGQLRRVAGLAQPLSPGAYGLVGQRFAAQVSQSDQQVSRLVGKLAEDAGQYAAGVNACIRDLMDHETSVAGGFGGMCNGDPTSPSVAVGSDGGGSAADGSGGGGSGGGGSGDGGAGGGGSAVGSAGGGGGSGAVGPAVAAPGGSGSDGAGRAGDSGGRAGQPGGRGSSRGGTAHSSIAEGSEESAVPFGSPGAVDAATVGRGSGVRAGRPDLTVPDTTAGRSGDCPAGSIVDALGPPVPAGPPENGPDAGPADAPRPEGLGVGHGRHDRPGHDEHPPLAHQTHHSHHHHHHHHHQQHRHHHEHEHEHEGRDRHRHHPHRHGGHR